MVSIESGLTLRAVMSNYKGFPSRSSDSGRWCIAQRRINGIWTKLLAAVRRASAQSDKSADCKTTTGHAAAFECCGPWWKTRAGAPFVRRDHPSGVSSTWSSSPGAGPTL